MKTGDIIRVLRIREGWNQTDLARHLDLSRSTVSMYENGDRTPSAAVYEQMSDLFNVDVDYLMGRTTKVTMLPERLAHENESTSADSRYVLDKIKNASDSQMKTIRRLVDAIMEEDENNQ